jgi:hypothetical protein
MIYKGYGEESLYYNFVRFDGAPLILDFLLVELFACAFRLRKFYALDWKKLA